MAHDGKIKAITDFVRGCSELKADIKADAEQLLKAMPIDVLTNEEALTAYLAEMLDVLVERHVITDAKKIRPRPARMIRAYVDGLTKHLEQKP
jgi:hypothetical protein